LPAIGKSQAGDFCGDLNVAHTELDLATPSRIAAKRASRKKSAGFRSSWMRDSSIPFGCSRRATGTYSWWSHFANSRARNVGWRIDYVLVSRQLRDAVKQAEIHPTVMGSDHCPVSITLDA
jgi:exodeoxyribonuclease-3